MTTAKATQAGREVEDAKRRVADKSMTKIALKDLLEKTSFKEVPAFTKMFGEQWDLINKIATDPAHEFQNLILDLLALLCNAGSMKLKTAHWREEKKFGRFRNFGTSHGAPVAPWHISACVKSIITGLIESGKFRVPAAWPKNMSYFSD
jgi:hypothetical protein